MATPEGTEIQRRLQEFANNFDIPRDSNEWDVLEVWIKKIRESLYNYADESPVSYQKLVLRCHAEQMSRLWFFIATVVKPSGEMMKAAERKQ